MSKEIGGINDMPGDSIPSEAIGGPSPSTISELNAALEDYYSKVDTYKSMMDDLDNERAAYQSGIKLLEELVNVVEGIVPAIIKHAESKRKIAPSKTGVRNSLSSILSNLLRTPKEDQKDVLNHLFQELIGGYVR